jgi:hypothetical protein
VPAAFTDIAYRLLDGVDPEIVTNAQLYLDRKNGLKRSGAVEQYAIRRKSYQSSPSAMTR